ncbi:MAG: hypothetical protein PVJ67_05380 [Candidatus Pacearchaeota archaeon]|jgi:hypothetical protein
MTEKLDELFIRLIAEHDGIKPEEVTCEYIEQQKEKRIYPNGRFFYSYQIEQLNDRILASI